MNNKKLLFANVVAMLGTVLSVRAVCPLCAVAVGAGVGLSRCLGIDDSITGVWLGGLLTAILLWFLNWARVRLWYTKITGVLIALGYYAVNVGTFLFFFWFSSCPLNIGLYKIVIGFMVGSIFFYASVVWYEWLKKNHGGRAYFPFQKIVMPVVMLAIASAVVYWLTH